MSEIETILSEHDDEVARLRADMRVKSINRKSGSNMKCTVITGAILSMGIQVSTLRLASAFKAIKQQQREIKALQEQINELKNPKNKEME